MDGCEKKKKKRKKGATSKYLADLSSVKDRKII